MVIIPITDLNHLIYSSFVYQPTDVNAFYYGVPNEIGKMSVKIRLVPNIQNSENYVVLITASGRTCHFLLLLTKYAKSN